MKIPDPHKLGPYVLAAMALAALVQILILIAW